MSLTIHSPLITTASIKRTPLSPLPQTGRIANDILILCSDVRNGKFSPGTSDRRRRRFFGVFIFGHSSLYFFFLFSSQENVCVCVCPVEVLCRRQSKKSCGGSRMNVYVVYVTVFLFFFSFPLFVFSIHFSFIFSSLSVLWMPFVSLSFFWFDTPHLLWWCAPLPKSLLPFERERQRAIRRCYCTDPSGCPSAPSVWPISHVPSCAIASNYGPERIPFPRPPITCCLFGIHIPSFITVMFTKTDGGGKKETSRRLRNMSGFPVIQVPITFRTPSPVGILTL